MESSANLKDANDIHANAYEDWCIYRLSEEFPHVRLPTLREAFRRFEGNLASTRKAVKWEFGRAKYQADQTEGKKASRVVVLKHFVRPGCTNALRLQNPSWLAKGIIKLLKKCPRVSVSEKLIEPGIQCPRLERDWAAFQAEIQNLRDGTGDEGFYAERLEILDYFAALDLLESPPVDYSITCGCCFLDFAFEDLFQCADGHLFCADCLRRHFENYVFGTSQACGLLPSCMDTDGCDKAFPWSEVTRALPADVLSKYEQRQAEVSVAMAKLEGLVYCPFCNHPWEVESGIDTLVCEIDTCSKASCIKCQRPAHAPQSCEEIKIMSETSARTRVEELMSKALIRECVSCQAELVKSEGCNRIKCRCGQKMCYCCRRKISSYSHFCNCEQDVGRRGFSCASCSKCLIWHRENETKVVEKAKEAAMKGLMTTSRHSLRKNSGQPLRSLLVQWIFNHFD